MKIGFANIIFIIAFLALTVKVVDLIDRKKDIEELIISTSFAQEEQNNNQTDQQEERTPVGEETQSIGDAEGDEVQSVEQLRNFSEAEIEILQRLSERRKKLQKWQEDLVVKENVLNITEERIANKIAELRKLKKDLEVALKEYRQEESEKTKTLVKIYENMKSKNAAEIMSRMDIRDIVPIISRMKERNSAQVLADMDPKIAKEVTTKLTRIGNLD